MHYYLLHLKMFVLNLFWKGQFISGGQRKMDGNRKLIQVKAEEIELSVLNVPNIGQKLNNSFWFLILRILNFLNTRILMVTHILTNQEVFGEWR